MSNGAWNYPDIDPLSVVGRMITRRDRAEEESNRVRAQIERYKVQLKDLQRFLRAATPEDDALEIAKATAMVPVHERTLERLSKEHAELGTSLHDLRTKCQELFDEVHMWREALDGRLRMENFRRDHILTKAEIQRELDRLIRA